MTRWGYDDVTGIIIGGNELSCGLFYDGRNIGGKWYADNQDEAMVKARELKAEQIKENGGHPCYLYQDDSKWELRIFD